MYTRAAGTTGAAENLKPAGCSECVSVRATHSASLTNVCYCLRVHTAEGVTRMPSSLLRQWPRRAWEELPPKPPEAPGDVPALESLRYPTFTLESTARPRADLAGGVLLHTCPWQVLMRTVALKATSCASQNLTIFHGNAVSVHSNENGTHGEHADISQDRELHSANKPEILGLKMHLTSSLNLSDP